MKKIICSLLVFLVAISLVCPVFANDFTPSVSVDMLPVVRPSRDPNSETPGIIGETTAADTTAADTSATETGDPSAVDTTDPDAAETTAPDGEVTEPAEETTGADVTEPADAETTAPGAVDSGDPAAPGSDVPATGDNTVDTAIIWGVVLVLAVAALVVLVMTHRRDKASK